jgi:hypothetical protein
MENYNFTNSPTDPKTLGPEFTALLRQFSNIPDIPHIHSKAIAYRHAGNRRNWAGHLPEDPHSRSTFSEFWNEPKQGRRVWLGCFTTTTENTVRPDWDELVWHVWGAAVIGAAEGRGKHLIIWDCDPRATYDEDRQLRRRRDIMFGFQKDLAAYAKAHCSLSGVWYNVDSSKSGEDKCLAHTLEWIQEMVAAGDLPFEGENDPRVRNCVLLSRL